MRLAPACRRLHLNGFRVTEWAALAVDWQSLPSSPAWTVFRYDQLRLVLPLAEGRRRAPHDARSVAAPKGPALRSAEENTMSRFWLREIRVDNFRCFDELRLPLEEDTTVLFAENGGGKTAMLTALAMGVAVFQRGSPKSLRLDARRDPSMRTLDEGRREAGRTVQARVDR